MTFKGLPMIVHQDLTLKEFILNLMRSYGEKKALSVLRKEWVTYSYTDVVDLALSLAGEIKKLNLKPEDKVAIILDSAPEYASAFFASGLLGHTTLLLDAKLTPEEMKSILDHSDSKAIITGFTAKNATEKLCDILSEKLPVIQLETVVRSGRSADILEAELSTYQGLHPEDIALLVYTSGTTSEPKGVMITLGSILFDANAVISSAGPNQDPVFLSILPLNHTLEFTGGLIIPLSIGAHVVYANTLLPHEVMERFQAFRYTDMIVVPLFLRSIRAALMREVSKSKAKGLYFKIAFALARILPFMALRRKLFAPVVKKFGGLQRFICGGAALEFSTQEFFTLMGFTVCQGYGLTETAPVTTVTYREDKLLGTQGRALPGTELKIDEATGEILLRGPHIMKGYYKKPELTAQVFALGGWFKTGDIGHLDKNGNLFITGRLKELIVCGNGKKVFPDEVESLMKISDNIKEILIVGALEKSGTLKGTEAVCAVVVPTEELMKKADLMVIREIVEKEIRKNAETLAAYKKPSRVYLSFQELPKTNTRKNKRTLIKRMIEEGAFDESRLSDYFSNGVPVYNHPAADLLSGRREIQSDVVGDGVSTGIITSGRHSSVERPHT